MNREFFRKYLDILNEGPPPGVGPNATRQAPQQQLGQPDTFTKMLPGMGNKAIDAGKGLVNPYAKTMSNFTPGSEYYEKNVKNNPQVKAQVDAFMKTAPTAKDLGASVDATKQAFDQALTQKQTVGGTSAEYDKAAGQLGMPTVQQPTQPQQTQPTTEEELDENGRMRKLLDVLDEAPATAINPNDPNAAAFGKKINTTSSTTVQPTPQSAPTNVDFQATRSRDRLQQQMASGKINTPAPQTVNPNQKYGGGYDPTKVQYASGNNQAAPTASASQSASLDASKTKAIGGTPQTASAAQSQANQTSKANVIGAGMQQMAQNNQNPSIDPYNPATDPSLQAGYAAVAKPDVEGLKLGVAAGTPSAAQTNQQTQTASTGGGFKGGGYGSVGTQTQSTTQPTQTASTGGGFQGGGYGSVGNQGQTAQVEEEELEEELQKILRLSGKQKQTTNENDSFKKFYSILSESIDSDEIALLDSFDIELNEHFVIETGIVGFTEDGIIIEADETLLGLLEVNNILCEDETMDQREEEVAEGEQGLWANIHAKRKRIKSGSGERMRKPGSKGAPTAQNFRDAAKEGIESEMDEAKYQGREVPLGKPMAGDVAKSKVYVKKPNGKVVKVNFGDKNMKIKKSNPNRRKSFRARHRCENPGPRWKARYWSCRAW